MAINNIRQYGVRTVPLLKTRVSFGDIVNDINAGGTAVPASAELVKNVQAGLNVEIADRVQQNIDLIGGASTNGNTLAKLENLVGTSSSSNSDAIKKEVADRNAAIKTESDRAVAAEKANADAVAKEVTDRTSAINSASTTLTASIDAETKRASDAEKTVTANITTLNGDDTVTGSIASKIKVESDRATAEEARIETSLANEIKTRTDGVASKKYTDDAVKVETDRAAKAEADNTTAIGNEVTARATAISKVDTNISNLTKVVSDNKSALTNAIVIEASTRSDADTALSDRLTNIEGTVTAGVAWKGSVKDLTALAALKEADIEAGQAYYVTSEKDVYVVIPGTSGDFTPDGYTKKSFIKIADFTELSGLVSSEKNRALAAEAALDALVNKEITDRTNAAKANADDIVAENKRAVAAEKVNADAVTKMGTDYVNADNAVRSDFAAADTKLQDNLNKEVTSLNTTIASNKDAASTALKTESDRAVAAEKANTDGITVLNGDDTVAGSVASKVKTETDRAVAAEKVNADAVAKEVTDRVADVDAEEARAKDAEKVLTDNLAKEVTDRDAAIKVEADRATASEKDINSKMDTLNGDKTVAGSVANAQFEAQVYADHWIPMLKLEGTDGKLKVSGDDVTVIYNPIPDGVIYGEVIVYDPDTGDAIAVNIKSIAKNVLTLDTTKANEFDGYACKVQYMFREGDQSGAGMGEAGEGGAGE